MNSSVIPLSNIRCCLNILLETLHVWKYFLDFFGVKKREIKNKCYQQGLRVIGTQLPWNIGLWDIIKRPQKSLLESNSFTSLPNIKGWMDRQAEQCWIQIKHPEWVEIWKFLRIFSVWVSTQCSREERLFLMWVF